MDNDAYRRAYRILEFMAEADDIPEPLMERLTAWLISDDHREEKDAATWKLFCEVMEGGGQDEEQSLCGRPKGRSIE